jgi:large subunit ribosomal protein L29
MYIEEIREKSVEDLIKDLDTFYIELMNLRFRLASRQLGNVYEIKKLKKTIAQILTVLKEREMGIR